MRLLTYYRRTVFLFLCGMIPAFCGAQVTYPARPVRIVVPFTPGGINDFAARAIAVRLGESLGQPVVIDNRPSAGGVVGTEYVAQSAPDGYTLVAGSIGTHAINENLYAKLSYRTLRDFLPITTLLDAPNLVVVHPSLPVRSIGDLITLARRQPGKINYGSAGSGTATHLSAELFKSMTSVDIVHVPYRGAAPSVVDLISGELGVIFSTMPSSLAHVRSGRLRPVAVTGSRRSKVIPGVPTIDESGVQGYEFYGWVGLFAPIKTPPEVISRLYGDTAVILRTVDMRERFIDQGGEPGGLAPLQFTNFIKNEIAKWGKVIRFAGIRQE